VKTKTAEDAEGRRGKVAELNEKGNGGTPGGNGCSLFFSGRGNNRAGIVGSGSERVLL
jgi:hypothetical protein